MPSITKFIALASICSMVLAAPAATTTSSSSLSKSSTKSSTTKSNSTTKTTSSSTKINSTSKSTSDSSKTTKSTGKSKTKTSSTSSTCQTVTTATGTFDDLFAGATPTPGYGAISYVGFWDVVAASDWAFSSPSSPNIVMTAPQGSYITGTDDNVEDIFQLNSFYFGCGTNIDGEEFIPSDCSLLLVTDTASLSYSIQSFGPYNFAACDLSDGVPCNMTQVTLPSGSSAMEFYFVVTSGSGDSSLFLDNVVSVAPNLSCPSN